MVNFSLPLMQIMWKYAYGEGQKSLSAASHMKAEWFNLLTFHLLARKTFFRNTFSSSSSLSKFSLITTHDIVFLSIATTPIRTAVSKRKSGLGVRCSPIERCIAATSTVGIDVGPCYWLVERRVLGSGLLGWLTEGMSGLLDWAVLKSYGLRVGGMGLDRVGEWTTAEARSSEWRDPTSDIPTSLVCAEFMRKVAFGLELHGPTTPSSPVVLLLILQMGIRENSTWCWKWKTKKVWNRGMPSLNKPQ